MARKDNETKIKNKDERIVKRSWLRIGIITLIVLIVLSLIGTGIYFIVDSAKKEDYNVEGVEMNADIQDVTDDILDGDGSRTGIFFYTEGSTEANYLLRGDVIYDDGEDGLGAIAKAMEAEQIDGEEITWYGVNLGDKKNEFAEETLFIDPESSSEDPMLREQFEYLGNGSLRGDALWYFSLLSAAESLTDYQDVDSYKEDYFSMKAEPVDGNEDDDYKLAISTSDDASDDTTYTDWVINNGTFMLFNGEQLTTLVDGWTTPSESEGDSETTNTTYNEIYEDFIDELLLHNLEYPG